MSELFVTFSTNDKYVRHGRSLLNSLNKNYPFARTCVRLINVSKERVDSLKNSFPGTEFIDDINGGLSSELKHLKADAPLGRGKMFSEEMAYSCHSRFDNIDLLMKSGARYILSVDADTIFRRDLSGLFRLIQNNDLVINDCGGNFTEEGVFGLRVNKITKKFFDRVREVVGSDWMNWDIDTKAFRTAYLESKDKLTLCNLPVSYKDKELGMDSHIWSGDGISKLRSNYIREVRRYT